MRELVHISLLAMVLFIFTCASNYLLTDNAGSSIGWKVLLLESHRLRAFGRKKKITSRFLSAFR
jgi:hypothetical protein